MAWSDGNSESKHYNIIAVYIFDLDIEKVLFFSSKNNKGDIHDMTAD